MSYLQMSRHWIRCKHFACRWAHPSLSSSCSSSSIRCSCFSLFVLPVSLLRSIKHTFGHVANRFNLFCFLFHSHSHRSFSFFAPPDVSVSQPALHFWNKVCRNFLYQYILEIYSAIKVSLVLIFQQNFVWHLWPFHWR